MTDPTADFHAWLPQFEQATHHFMNGEARPWTALASRAADVTLMGAWGDAELGWGQVGPRYDWAAARFQPGGAALSVEYLATGVGGDLAFTVAIERRDALLTGEARSAPMWLRVTHLFRHEAGAWRLIHRHADPLIHKTEPRAVLQGAGL